MSSRNCQARPLHWRICISEQVADLSDPWAKLMFTWMIPNVDNLGRMEGEPYQVKGLCFPLEPDMTPERIEKLLAMLHEAGLIIWYKTGRLRYVQLPRFDRHQKLAGNMKSTSDFPAPSSEDIAKWEARMNDVCTTSEPRTNDVSTEVEVEVEDKETLMSGYEPDDPPPKVKSDLEDVKAVFAYWRDVMGKRSDTDFSPERKAVIRKALKRLTVQQCKQAIDGCAATDWNMGRDAKSAGKKYNDLTLIFRNAENWERFMETARSGTGSAPDTRLTKLAQIRRIRETAGDIAAQGAARQEGISWMEVEANV